MGFTFVLLALAICQTSWLRSCQTRSYTFCDSACSSVASTTVSGRPISPIMISNIDSGWYLGLRHCGLGLVRLISEKQDHYSTKAEAYVRAPARRIEPIQYCTAQYPCIVHSETHHDMTFTHLALIFLSLLALLCCPILYCTYNNGCCPMKCQNMLS